MNLLPSLKPKIERPFADKLLETQGLIAVNLHKFGDKVAVAFSGGKDSEVVLWLTLQLRPDVMVVFNNTSVEYPETVKFVHELKEKWKLNLIETKPVKTFWECVDLYGFPKGKAGGNDRCCDYCKEIPATRKQRELGIECVFDGMTAIESRTRMFAARNYGSCFHSKKYNRQTVHPILWWTEQEVRQYITDMGLPLNPIYSKGCDRCGCMPCTAFKSWEKQLRQTNPKMYAYIKLHKDKQYVMKGITT